MSASLLPEVRDEFERSFEQKEASKVVETNGEAKEQVRSVDLLYDSDAWLVGNSFKSCFYPTVHQGHVTGNSSRA